MITKIFEKDLLASWLSIFSKLLPLIVIIPYLLVYFTTPIVNIWLIFLSFYSIGILFEFGFTSTFERFISYSRSKASKKIKFQFSFAETVYSAKKIFSYLFIISIFVLLTVGSALIYKPINSINIESSSSKIEEFYFLWIFVAISTSVALYNFFFASFFRGSNRIFDYRIRESAANLITTLLSIMSLHFFKDFFTFCLIYFSASLLTFLLLRGKFKSVFKSTEIKTKSSPVMRYAWGSAWRSGLGVIFSVGAINMIGIVLAQFVDAVELGKFLLSVRIIQSFAAISNPFFYIKIPQMALIYNENDRQKAEKIGSQRLMVTMTFFISLLLLFTALYPFINSLFENKILILDKFDWAILCAAFIIERLSSLYLQIYTLSNNVIWHKVNFLTLVTIIFFSTVLFNHYYLLGVCYALLISYALIAYPYNISSYLGHFKTSFFPKELKIILIFFFMPILFFILYNHSWGQ